MLDLLVNPEDRFSYDTAHIYFQGSPARHPVPDLWVNTNTDVPLTPIDTRRDIRINGGETLGGQRLSGMYDN